MLNIPVSIEQVLGCRGHVYVLRHATQDKYRLVESNGWLPPERSLNTFLSVDRDNSHALLIEGVNEWSDLMGAFSKCKRDHRSPLGAKSGTRWYGPSLVRALHQLMDETDTPVYRVSLNQLYPTSSAGRHALAEAQQAWEDRRLDAARQEERARLARQDEEFAQAQLAKLRRLRETLIQEGTFLDWRAPGDTWKASITQRLVELNRLTSGHCEFNNQTGAFEFWVRYEQRRSALEISKALSLWHAGPHDPAALPMAEEGLECFPLLEPMTQDKHIRGPLTSGTHRYFIKLGLGAFDKVYAMLKELTPGIRGWDLPLDAKVGSFDPALSKRFAPKVPAEPAPPWKQLWDRASPLDPQAELPARWKQRLGESPWLPPSLRLSPAKTSGADRDALLLLLRTPSDTPCGVQRIYPDDWSTELLQEPTVAGFARMFHPKRELMVTASLEDAFALREVLRTPVWVTPTPAALESLMAPVGCTQVQVRILSESGHPLAQWQAAAARLQARLVAGPVALHTATPLELATPADTFEPRLQKVRELVAGQHQPLC